MKKYIRLLAIGYWLCIIACNADAETAKILNISPEKPSVGLYEKFELKISISAAYKNPYDPEDIDLEVEFASPSGKIYRIPAFYFQDYKRSIGNGGAQQILQETGNPVWMVRFSPTETGTWKYRVSLKAGSGAAQSDVLSFKCVPSKEHGFVRQSKKSPNYFAFDDGTIFIPIGENLCWFNARRTYDYDEWCSFLAKNGANFIRLWMAPWAFTPEWKDTGLGRYSQKRGYELDYVFELCEQLELYNMLCLLNHGQFSVSNDPKWAENPYNIANGGPCKDQKDFLTDPIARKFFKMRLRYIVSRWGYSRNLAAWEWFNESDLSDLDNKDLIAWLDDMSKCLKSCDPYNHIISTSFHHLSPKEVWSRPDIGFTQLHKYDVRDFALEFNDKLVSGYVNEYKKPFMINEFGWIQDIIRRFDNKGIHIHDGMWASLLSGAAGPAMTWYWDNYIHENRLYYHFYAISRYIQGEDWLSHKFRKLDYIIENTDKLLVRGMQDKQSAYFWLKNSDATVDEYIAYLMEKAKNHIRAERGIKETPVSFPPAVIKGATISISNISGGWYKVFWYDTYTGDIEKTEKILAKDGRIELMVPEVSRDIACKVIKETGIEMFKQYMDEMFGGKKR